MFFFRFSREFQWWSYFKTVMGSQMEFKEESFYWLNCSKKGNHGEKKKNPTGIRLKKSCKRIKEDSFLPGNMLLIWDAQRDQKGQHSKFDNLWLGPFKISKILVNNTFVLKNLEGEELLTPVNGRFLKSFYMFWKNN